jgi:hypothetical protein
MQDTLKSTLDMIRAVSKAAGIKIHRGFTDFLADRIVQATTQPSLLSMMERLAALLNTEMEYVGGKKIAAFMQRVNALDAEAVLDWLRDYPRVVAMVVMQKSDEIYEECIKDLEVPVSIMEKGTALPSATPGVIIKMTCLSPLAHGADAKAGNATIFRRMQVLSTTGQVLSLPFYAGNALRGQMRDLLADHFLQALDLTPSKDDPPCNLWFFHALYAGGALEENSAQAKALSQKLGSSGAVRAEGVHELRDMIQPCSVLGTALGNRVLSGRVNFCDFRPQCAEWGNGDISVGNLFEWTYLTRREDYENHEQGHNSSMIANTECLKAGTVLAGGIDISTHATDIERACIGKGLAILQSSGYIGAENRRGLGQVQFEIENLPDASKYDEYLEKNRLRILNYLEEIGAIHKQGDLL